jgi:hypothetical protein
VLESSNDAIAQRSAAGALFNLSLDRQALAPLEQKGVAALCANAFATWRTVPLPVLERLLATYAHLRLVECVCSVCSNCILSLVVCTAVVAAVAAVAAVMIVR